MDCVYCGKRISGIKIQNGETGEYYHIRCFNKWIKEYKEKYKQEPYLIWQLY